MRTLLVATLLAVSASTATSLSLTPAFAQPEQGPAETLRAAQRVLTVDFPHPFAWAALRAHRRRAVMRVPQACEGPAVSSSLTGVRPRRKSKSQPWSAWSTWSRNTRP